MKRVLSITSTLLATAAIALGADNTIGTKFTMKGGATVRFQ